MSGLTSTMAEQHDQQMLKSQVKWEEVTITLRPGLTALVASTSPTQRSSPAQLVDEATGAFRLVALRELCPGNLSSEFNRIHAGTRFLRLHSTKTSDGQFEFIAAVSFPKEGHERRGDTYMSQARFHVVLNHLQTASLACKPNFVEYLDVLVTSAPSFDDAGSSTFAFSPSSSALILNLRDQPSADTRAWNFKNNDFNITLLFNKRGEKRFLLEHFPSDLFLDIATSDSDLTLLDIQRLGQAFPHSKSSHLESIPAQRLRNHLVNYFKTPSDLGTLLLGTGSLLTSSIVLSVLVPGKWVPGDVDLVVPPLAEDVLVKYVLQEGYRLDLLSVAAMIDYGLGDSDPYSFEQPQRFRRLTFLKDKLKIDILVPDTATAVDYILSFHSSVVMNYWTGEEIVCLFPHLTFSKKLKRPTHSLTFNTSRKDIAVEKYTNDRGYELVDAALDGEFKVPRVMLEHLFAALGNEFDGYDTEEEKKIMELTMDRFKGKSWRVKVAL